MMVRKPIRMVAPSMTFIRKAIRKDMKPNSRSLRRRGILKNPLEYNMNNTKRRGLIREAKIMGVCYLLAAIIVNVIAYLIWG
jgi:hypothetical protein